MFWKVKKEPLSESDNRIDQIREILFPKLHLCEQIDKDGTKIKYHVDYSADSNLDAVLMDMQDGYCDAPMMKTMNSIIERLNQVRKILEAYAEIDSEARYILVSDGKEDEDIHERES